MGRVNSASKALTAHEVSVGTAVMHGTAPDSRWVPPAGQRRGRRGGRPGGQGGQASGPFPGNPRARPLPCVEARLRVF